MYFRNATRVRSFWDDVYASHDLVAYYRSQQEPLNVLLAAHAHRGLNVSVLDEGTFANGHLYLGEGNEPTNPWVVHLGWTSDLTEKLERYSSNNLWFLDVRGPLDATVLAITDEQLKQGPAQPGRSSRQAVAGPVRTSATTADATSGALIELLRNIGRERDALQRALDATRSSTSWRLTLPLRKVKDAFSR